MQALQTLFDALTIKQLTGGARTWIVIGIIAAGVIAEQLFKVDIPGLNFTWEMLLTAIGIKTAADHVA